MSATFRNASLACSRACFSACSQSSTDSDLNGLAV